jgi:hypothetical protein
METTTREVGRAANITQRPVRDQVLTAANIKTVRGR